ncbi:hypothetical protein QO004_005359 [Rhizobium mesoamericanum]|nr:hypothetical protein [Rhizobium mesoamericanum]
MNGFASRRNIIGELGFEPSIDTANVGSYAETMAPKLR